MASSPETQSRRAITPRTRSELAGEALADFWIRVPAKEEPRLRGPQGERLTDAETEPIRVHRRADTWCVDYGSYAQGYHGSRDEAIATAVIAAARENRELMIERPRRLT